MLCRPSALLVIKILGNKNNLREITLLKRKEKKLNVGLFSRCSRRHVKQKKVSRGISK